MLGHDKNKIYITLKQLMKRKSRRDGKEFTLSRLAKNLKMPHSMLIKLLHEDPDRRVHNPRIDTLGRIIDFFRADGFDITLDDVLCGLKPEEDEEDGFSLVSERRVPIFAFDAPEKKMADIKMTLPKSANRMVGLLSDEPISPVFGPKSIFIVDKDYPIGDGCVVAVKLLKHQKIVIGKIRKDGDTLILLLPDPTSSDRLVVAKETDYSMMGVVVQVNAHPRI